MKTPFEDFYAVVAADDRSQTLDRGNVESAFNSVGELSEVSREVVQTYRG